MSEAFPGTALITGAAGAIGAAVASRLLAEGWRVLGWDVLPGPDTRIEWSSVDVQNWDEVAAAAAKLPPLRGAVTSAGIGIRHSALETSRADWERTIGINLTGTFQTARFVHDALARGQGTLVTIASVTATSGFRNRSAYCASKAGVLMLTRCLAAEWATHGIRAVCVSPGYANTPLVQRGVEEGKSVLDDVLAHTPQNRLVEPEEIAAVIWHLIGTDFSAVTGSNILVDGGFDALTGL